MQPDSAAFLWDALDAAETIARFLDGISSEDYLRDILRRRAVERELEIIGEALNRLRRADPATATRIPGLDTAVGMRNVLIHGYAEVVDERVYDTAVADVPRLIGVLTPLLAEANDHD